MGGAAAASAEDPEAAERGANIMVAGIIVQMGTLLVVIVRQADILHNQSSLLQVPLLYTVSSKPTFYGTFGPTVLSDRGLLLH